MPSASSVAMPAVALTRPGRRRAGLGDAEVQRVVDASRRAAGRPRSSAARSTPSPRSSRRRSRPRRSRRARCCADSTIASGVTPPCCSYESRVERARVHADADRQAAVLGLARRRALMCSGLRMLPGLSRRPCTPASIAASASLYWWWMSATIGTGERGTIWARPSAASLLVAGAAHDVAAGARRARRSAAACPRRRPSW